MPPAKRQRKAEDEILDLDYLANNSSLDGMLSHLKPELRTAFGPAGPSAEPPMGEAPLGEPLNETDTPEGSSPMGVSIEDLEVTPALNIAGVGVRRIHRCRSVQDGHTNGEQIAYMALRAYGKRFGRAEEDGSCLVELGIARVCQILSTDHKHARRLLTSLEAKLAIEVVRPPDFRLNSPTVYRVFNQAQILERRAAAGLLWVVRNRATRFLPLEQVKEVLGDQPLG